MTPAIHPSVTPGILESSDAVIETPHDAMGAQVFRGSWISLTGQTMQLLVRLGSTVVLARLLTADAYGLVAMVTVLTGFISLFKSLGLATATIQAPRLTHAEVNGLFWVNAGVGCAAMIVTIALAPLMAWFYAEPRVTSLAIGLSVTFPLAGLAVQPGALLRRSLRFGASSSIEVGSVAAGAVAAILLASSGAGSWALVGGVVTTEAMNLTLAWGFVGWKPTRPAFDAKIGNLVALGRDLTQFNVLNYWARNLDNFLIGRYWGAAALGIYGRAYQLLLLPLQQVTTPLAPVAIAALSRLHDDESRLRQAYVRILEKVTIVCMPLTMFLFFNAGQVVELALGPRWLNVAPIFTPLAAAGLVQPVSATLIWLLVSQGRRTELRRWSIVGPALSCAAIVAGLPRGAVGVATAYAACEVLVRAPLLTWMVGRRGAVRVSDVLRAIGPGVAASMAVFVACQMLALFFVMDGFNGLAVSLATSIAAAGAILLTMPTGRGAFRDVMSVMRSPVRGQPVRVEAVLL